MTNYIKEKVRYGNVVKKAEPAIRREDVCFIRENGKDYCIDPLDEVLTVLARRWTLFVIGVLGNKETARFNELKRSIPGIAARALADRLGDLSRLQLIERRVDASVSPPGVSYLLTSRGRGMRKALVPVLQWAETGTPGR